MSMDQNTLETAAVETAAVKPRNRWRRFLLIWAGLLLLIGLIGCILLYRYVGIYEITRPEVRMDALMESMDAEQWLDAAAENLDFEVSEFEDAQALYKSYRDSLTLDQPLSYRSSKKDSDSDTAVFVVRSGAANLCRVELIPGESAYGFGRHDWQLGRVSTGDITDSLQSAAVSVTALAGQEILLNGVPLGEAYLVEKQLPIEDLSPLEQRMETPPAYVRYQVSPLYGEIRVTDAEGQELFPAAESGAGRLAYNAAPGGVYAVSISAPEDVIVTVNGVTLSADDAVSGSEGALSGLEYYTEGAAYQTLQYQFDGLYTAPTVTARDADGQALEPLSADGTHLVFLHKDPAAAEELRPIAEAFFTAYLTYTSSPFDLTRLYQVLGLTLSPSELYQYLADSQAAMLWAAHTTMEFEQMEYDNFSYVGDRCFVCTVEYAVDTTASTWQEDVSYGQENVMELVFVMDERYGEWRCAALNLVSQ